MISSILRCDFFPFANNSTNIIAVTIVNRMPANSIPVRKLGKDGPSVPALGFGLMGLSIAYGAVPNDEERFAVLDRAVELGATFWDTSEYGTCEPRSSEYC